MEKNLRNKNINAADDFARKMKPVIDELQKEGITTVRRIAQELRNKKYRAFRGKRRWHINTVYGLLSRIEKIHSSS